MGWRRGVGVVIADEYKNYVISEVKKRKKRKKREKKKKETKRLTSNN